MCKLFTPLVALALLIASTSTRAQASAPDASCQPVNASVVAMVKTNRYHSIGTMTDEGKPYTMEDVYVDNMIYRKTPGSQWAKIPATPQERIDDMKSITTFSGCHMVGTESVHGETAIVYQGHSYTKETNTHAEIKYWISTKSGLPLRIDEDAPPGETPMHISNLFTYGASVQAPAGS